MKALSLFLAVAFLAAIMGCTREEQYAGAGAAGGALLGAIIGHKAGDTAEGAAVGALAGMVGGYLVGKMQTAKEAGAPAEVKCPHCNYTMGLPSTARAGDIVRCPSCRKEFLLQ